jgi:hypothetical protein
MVQNENINISKKDNRVKTREGNLPRTFIRGIAVPLSYHSSKYYNFCKK